MQDASLSQPVADDQHAVVEVAGTAQPVGRVRDASEIELHRIGIDPNRQGSLPDQVAPHVSLVGRQFDVGVDFDARQCSIEVALLVAGVIGVVGFRFDAA